MAAGDAGANSDRPFNPQALLAILKSGATVLDEGSVSGPGWAGTRYKFTVSHPAGTGAWSAASPASWTWTARGTFAT